ncbi:MAG: hypothetical protein HGA44_18495 [Cellulomonadaceae bacterium]|nr:hypothetical protein [Cellulomonadaceae bacterium]
MRPVVHVFQLYTTGGEDLVWWRFISPNGRSLARCASPLTSTTEARASIATTVGALDRATASVRPASDNRWRWALSIDGELAVLGSGDQDRRVRCEHAWQRFVVAAPLAVVDQTVHSFRRRDHGRTAQAIG